MELSQEQLNRIFLYLDGMYSTRLDSLDNLARKNANSLSLIKVQIENLTKSVNSLFVSQNYKLNNGSLTTNFSDFFKTVIKEPNLLGKTTLPSAIKKPSSSKNGSTMDKQSKNYNNNYNNTKLVSPKKPQTQTKNSHKTVTNGFVKKIVPLKSDFNNFNSLLVKKSKNYDSDKKSKSSLKSLNNSFKSDRSRSSLKTGEKSRDKLERIKIPKTPSRIKSEELFFKNRRKVNDNKNNVAKSEMNIDSSFSKTEKNLPCISPDNSYSSAAKRKRSNSSYHPGKKKEIIRTIISAEKESEIYRKSSQNLELNGNNEGLESSNEPKEKAIIEKINAQYDILNNILNISPISALQKNNSIQLEQIIEEEMKGRKEEEETEEFLKTEEKVKTEGGEEDYDDDEIM